MSLKYHPVSHVIFDLDGLLIDSEQYYQMAISKICSQYAKEFTYPTKVLMMGSKPLEGASICIERLGLSDRVRPDDFVNKYEREMDEYCSRIKLMPGAEKLVNYFRQNSIPMAIATGSTRMGFERKTHHLGQILSCPPFSHHVYAGSDPEVARGKPYPDVFEVAARRFVKPAKSRRNILVFEDAINGVRAAEAAGMQVALVPDKWTIPELGTTTAKPTVILDSLEQFDPQHFGLPPFKLSSL